MASIRSVRWSSGVDMWRQRCGEDVGAGRGRRGDVEGLRANQEGLDGALCVISLRILLIGLMFT